VSSSERPPHVTHVGGSRGPAEGGTRDSFPEKRTFLRYPRWFPVTLTALGDRPDDDAAANPIGAICRDASAGGIQVSSLVPFDVGTKVEARFRISRRPDCPEHVAAASVVRSDTNDDELMLAFPFRLGLRFVTPIPELPEELGAPPQLPRGVGFADSCPSLADPARQEPTDD
jgi:hypothetical protein